VEGLHGSSLEDNALKDFIDQEVPKPIDATQLAEWKKCVARVRRIILEEFETTLSQASMGRRHHF